MAKQPKITAVITESQSKNKDVGRQFYRYIFEQLEQLKNQTTK